MKGLRWKKQQYSSLGGAYGIRQRYMTVFISDRNDKAVFFCFYNTEKEASVSGSCIGTGVRPGKRERVKVSPDKVQWRTGPRVTQVRQRRMA